MKTIKLNFDGSCIKNPNGAMGFGCLIVEQDTQKRIELSGGEAAAVGNTNNVAEYRALLLGLDHCFNYKDSVIEIYGDSRLVIDQISGNWKIKPNSRGHYVPFAKQARESIIRLFKENNNKLRFTWIPREQNTEADELSNLFHNTIDDDYAAFIRSMQ